MEIVRKEDNNRGNYKKVECHYNGTTTLISIKMFQSMMERMQYDNRKFVRYRDGAQIYGMSEREFNKLAHDANAVYKRGKLALVKLELVDKFMEELRNNCEEDS